MFSRFCQRTTIKRCSASPHNILWKFHRFKSTQATLDKEYYDIVIVGGGMVGNTMAAALANCIAPHMKVALIDKQKEPISISSGRPMSNRVISLSAGSMEFLRKIGVWEQLDITRICPYDNIKVWDDENSCINFDSDQRQMACIIENQNLISGALKQAKLNSKQIEFMHETGIRHISIPRMVSTEFGQNHPAKWSTESGYVEIETDTGRSILSGLVIGADGANSIVRKAANFSVHGWSYGQRGLVATLNHDEIIPRKTAYQKFSSSSIGIIAILPLSPTQSSLVWSTSPENAEKLQKMKDADFCTILNAALRLPSVETKYLLSQTSSEGEAFVNFEESIEWRFKNALVNVDVNEGLPYISGVVEKSRASFPLRFQRSSSFCDHRVVILGDAAHVIHPMAGQGVNLGLNDVEALYEVLEKGIQVGQDIGSYTTIKNYMINAELRTMPMMAGVDMLWNVYNIDSFPFTQLRSRGMKLVDSLPMLKSFIMGKAMKI